ncbi:MAG: ABC transporter ATP-binding protein [Methanomicrobiales archaeon HGW-Methanomicrobiales-1]|jgi:tungstate transport system ATP-binding protein|nr:MAG: ABC transporter ATP-binding protein [Methanomicrobiales archaeon HGW-Methanomicrobiales-1]
MIRISGLSRQAGGRKILDDINLEIRRGEIFTLIGPSGSGKTTLLRLIDLLDRPTTGKIFFDGQDTDGPEPVRLALRRRMGMVFQKSAALNTTVAENVAFGLKFRGTDTAQIAQRVRSALELVGLPGFEERRAVTLSGGEMQRVAIARAMVTEPEVLLLDEPTANLDPVSTELIEDLLVKINSRMHTTILFSTHDMIQGQRLAHRMGVIMNGCLAQVGSLHEIFYQPEGKEVARFVGIDTILKGVVQTNENGHATVMLDHASFEAITPCPPGKRVALYIRPEEVTISIPDGIQKTSVRNRLIGTITKLVSLGPFIRVTVECGTPITALITTRSCGELGLKAGMTVVASVKATAIHVRSDST